MQDEEDPETVAESLDGSVVVGGPREHLEGVAERTTAEGHRRVVELRHAGAFSEAASDAGVVVVAVDGVSSVADRIVRVLGTAEAFVVAVFDGYEDERVDLSLLQSVRRVSDVTLLAGEKPPSGDAPGPRASTTGPRSRPGVAVDGALNFVRMMRGRGQVNLDLADVRTVLTDGSLAVLGEGTASLGTDTAGTAVRRAFGSISGSIDPAQGSNALVSMLGGPETSTGDAMAALRAVREEVADVEELIWGFATDDTLADRMTVDVIIDDIAYRPPLSAGDPCRRCGEPLAAYAMGERTTLACEACGFADLSMSLSDGSESAGGT